MAVPKGKNVGVRDNPQPSFSAREEGSETKWIWVRADLWSAPNIRSERLRYSPLPFKYTERWGIKGTETLGFRCRSLRCSIINL
jgi:hypothetical protein